MLAAALLMPQSICLSVIHLSYTSTCVSSHFPIFYHRLRGWTRDVSHVLTGHYIDLCRVITQGLILALWISEEGWDQTETEHNDTEL